MLILISLCVGRYSFKIHDLFEIFENGIASTVFFQIRLPRVLTAVLLGGALALAGFVFQALFQNPLVSGDVLGVSQGSSVGAILAMLAGMSVFFIQIFSFIGGLLTVLICIQLSKKWKGDRILHLILAGIVMGALMNACIMLLKLSADPYQQLPTIEFWLMGSLSSIDWKSFVTVFPIITISSFLLYRLRYQIYLLSHGEEEAGKLGCNVQKVRFITIICATLLVSSAMSTAGLIGWVGLIAPHLVRLLLKRSLHEMMFECFICGGMLLLGADTIARTLWSFEMPISILTSILGALFLMGILSKRGIRL